MFITLFNILTNILIKYIHYLLHLFNFIILLLY